MHREARFLLALSLTVIGGTALAQTGIASERDVRFMNGAVELEGTMLLPAAKQPVPAVVFLHGSGPMTRAGFRPYAEAFAKLGVASLFYDKRGTGSSGGSWLTASLDDLSADGLAAVRYLKSQKEIDPKRIGFWGVSQAGWIAPHAAALSDDVGFMILNSGGGASPRESEMFSYAKEFEHFGLSEPLKAEAFEVIHHYFDYLATGTGRDAVVARLAELQKPDNPLAPLGAQLDRILPSEENRKNWSWVATYDPVADIARVRCPVLLMFGDQDRDQPTEVAIERWRKGLAKAGNDDVTIVVFPGAAHGIRLRHDTEGDHRAPFADGYQELTLGWLWQHVVQGGGTDTIASNVRSGDFCGGSLSAR